MTSNWAVFEAIGSVKRSRVQFNMLMQNTSFAYYDDVKDRKEFRLQANQVAEIKRLIDHLHRARAKLPWSTIRWSRVPIVFDDVMSFILLGLDAPDAVHAAVAEAEDCNIFVTRDRDFIKRTKALKPYFEILQPFEAVQRIQVSAKPRVTLAQVGPEIHDAAPTQHR